jgi:hypothetical protein
MADRPGFLDGFRNGDTSDRDAGAASPDSLIGAPPMVRLGDPSTPRPDDGFAGGTRFDPVWGTLSSPFAQADDGWAEGPREGEEEGLTFDVEIFGDGFQIAGQVCTGQFPRLSDWLNMQSGFIQVKNGMQFHPGPSDASDTQQTPGVLWCRLDQVIMVAERASIQENRPGAPVVHKQRRKVSIVTPGYHLRGSMHVIADGSMLRFLEMAEPHFLPVTDVTVHWQSDSALVARFSFAMINRQQIITVRDEPSAPAEGSTRTAESMPLHRRWGAA